MMLYPMKLHDIGTVEVVGVGSFDGKTMLRFRLEGANVDVEDDNAVSVDFVMTLEEAVAMSLRWAQTLQELHGMILAQQEELEL